MMTFELYALAAATFIGLVHVGAASFTFKAQVGTRYAVGPRDEDVRPAGMAGRMNRAQANFLETYPLFAALVLMAHLIEVSGAWSVWGCAMYVTGRALFLPLYAVGVPWLRTFSWNLASLGLALVGVQLFV